MEKSSSERAADTKGNSPTRPYTLELSPTEISRKSTLRLIPKGFDLSHARIEWQVNDRPFTTPVSTQFDGADAAKGAVIQAKATIGDGDRVVVSNVAHVVNSLPEVTGVKILPEKFKPGDTLYVEALGSDADDDSVTLLYEWTKNGEAASSGANIESPIKRGDTIEVKVTPFDGEGYGNPVVIRREIRNLPPTIIDHKDFSFEGSLYTYQVKASDPDGDKLSYSLESASPGMTIDSTTGLITWNVPEEFKGNKEVTALVTDGNSGTARYTISITIK
jgi:hypothetical protein